MVERSKNLLIGLAGVCGLIALVGVANNGGPGSFLLGALFFFGGLIYLIPSFVGFEKEQDNASAIFVLNLLLGWALIPWVIALIWAMSEKRSTQITVQHVAAPAPSFEPVGATRACPFCAETVKVEAKLCKHCRSELPAV